MKKAFTMVELIFVIVVIGILAAVAVPKLTATRDDAVISKALATVGAMRSAIATERQKRILAGNFTDAIDAADITGTPSLLEYPLNSTYWTGLNFSGGGKSCEFTIVSNKLVTGDCTLPGI